MFNEAIHQIKSCGVNVVSKYLAPTPVITVDRPVPGLIDKAISLNERVNGLNRVVFRCADIGCLCEVGSNRMNVQANIPTGHRVNAAGHLVPEELIAPVDKLRDDVVRQHHR